MHFAFHADLERGFLFVAHVDRRGGVVTREDDVQPRRASLSRAKGRDALRDFLTHALRYRFAVDEGRHVLRALTERGARRKRPARY
jgi:hypothetical protein